MIEIRCPNCESLRLVKHMNFNTRLVCDHCDEPFYVDETSGPVAGELPPALGGPDPGSGGTRIGSVGGLKRMQRRLRATMEEMPAWAIFALSASVLALFFLLWPVDDLHSSAEKAGQAFVNDDLAYLKSIAAPHTAEELNRWYDEVHRDLIAQHASWIGKGPKLVIRVASEDRATGTGSVGISIHPAAPRARVISIAEPGEATAPPLMPVELDTAWVLSRWGRWMLDGRATLAKFHTGS